MASTFAEGVDLVTCRFYGLQSIADTPKLALAIMMEMKYEAAFFGFATHDHRSRQ